MMIAILTTSMLIISYPVCGFIALIIAHKFELADGEKGIVFLLWPMCVVSLFVHWLDDKAEHIAKRI